MLSGIRPRIVFVASTIAVAILTFVAIRMVRARQVPGTPVLELPYLMLDLGSGKAGEIRDGVFQLRNLGTAPLAVSFRPSCGCSELSPGVASIPPGEALDVHIGIRLADEGAEKVVTVAISSNDPARPVSSYMVRTKCLAPLALTPNAAQFGDVAAGRSARVQITVRGGDGGPLPPGATLRAVSDSPHIAASVTRPVPGADALLRIELSPSAPSGSLRSEVRLSLEPGDLRMSLPVWGNVRDTYAVAPTVLGPPVKGERCELYFHVWRPDGKAIGDPAKIEAPPRVEVEALDAEGGRRRRYRVTAADVFPDGPIRLFFDDATGPAVIRLISGRPHRSAEN